MRKLIGLILPVLIALSGCSINTTIQPVEESTPKFNQQYFDACMNRKLQEVVDAGGTWMESQQTGAKMECLQEQGQ